MARETGIYRRDDSRLWWIATTLPNGRRIRQSAGTCDRTEAEALLAQLKVEAFREAKFGIKPTRTWQEAVVRYLSGKQQLRSFKDVQRICRRLDPYLGHLSLREISGDVIWQFTQQELKRGNQPATVSARGQRRVSIKPRCQTMRNAAFNVHAIKPWPRAVRIAGEVHQRPPIQ